MRHSLLLCILLLFGHPISSAQEHARLDLTLAVDYQSALKTLEIYEGRFGHPADVASLRGSQMSLAVTSMLAGTSLETGELVRSLEAAKFNQSDGEDYFRMRGARPRAADIRRLVEEMQKRNFGQKVVRTVEQLFPPQARIQARLPMYVVAFGHQNIDAFVTRVRWEDGMPMHDDRGEITIVVNCARGIEYGASTEERFIGVLSVVAHEVFHATFDLYKDASPFWRSYYASRRTPVDELFDLAHNEGIAYYLSLIQQSRGHLPPDGLQRATAAFSEFSERVRELADPGIAPGRVSEILRTSNMSGYWESFGSITGMIMARQIDQARGRSALLQTIESGPTAFFAAYAELMKRDRGLPAFSPFLLSEIARRR